MCLPQPSVAYIDFITKRIVTMRPYSKTAVRFGEVTLCKCFVYIHVEACEIRNASANVCCIT